MSIKITFIAFVVICLAAGLIPDQKPMGSGTGTRDAQYDAIVNQ